jgi:bifunctional UDP-N-acetylglucosamine pyrophosphorylase/glucosamine-1-phosphate N-acetyltransferase
MNNSVTFAGIILAAGKGTRMKSAKPKCAHEILGLPMAAHVGQAMKGAGVSRPVVVVGYESNAMKEALGDSFEFASQDEQLGTGHATMMAKDALAKHEGYIFIAPGDAPLLDSCVFDALAQKANETSAKLILATCQLDNPKGYGRIVRNSSGNICEIIEEKDASCEIRQIKEVCAGVYCVDSKTLFEYLPKLKSSNAQNEYYLTDLVKELSAAKHSVETLCFEDQDLLLGVNDLWQLAQVTEIKRIEVLKKHALNGVVIRDITNTSIDATVQIGAETIIEPMTILEGQTTIGTNCVIGPFSKISHSKVENNCLVLMSHLNQALMKESSKCGPFAHLRPLAEVGKQSKIGNFVEVKNAILGDEVSVSHLSYIGDAEIGSNSNIGAGTITCNYDGFQKNKTIIGSGAFVGSNSTLIAPIEIGDGAFVAAGSVITKSIPSDALGLARTRQENREAWAKSWRQRGQIRK